MNNKEENNKINNFKKKKVSDAFKNTMIIYVTTFIGVSIINKTIGYFKETFNKGIDASDIVITLLPFIVTTLSIVLSFSDKKIFGISYKSFKNIKRDSCFSFSEMIYFVIFTFIFYAIAAYFNLELTIILIDIFSIVFSFLFIYKEMPLIENNEEKLIQDVVKLFDDKIDNKFYTLIDNFDEEDDLIKAVEYLLINKGLRYSFNIFKKESSKNEIKILNSFICIYSRYLECFLKHKSPSNNGNYDDSTYKILEKSFSVLEELFLDKDIVKFYRNNNHESNSINVMVTEILYYLYKFTRYTDLFDYYKSNLFKTLEYLNNVNFDSSNEIFYYLNLDFFKISIVNRIIFLTIGLYNDFNFLNIKFDDDQNIPYILTFDFKYTLFLSIIFSSITCGIHINSNKKIGDVDKFTKSKFYFNGKQYTFNEFIEKKIKYITLNEVINLLPIFFELYNSTYGISKNKSHEPLYFYIIDSWIELLFYFYSIKKFQYQSQTLNKMLNQFNDEERIQISKRLNLWFYGMNFKMQSLNFINKILPNLTKFNINSNEEIIEDLFKFKNDSLKIYVKSFYLNDHKIKEFANSIQDGIDENLGILRFKDETLKCRISITSYLNYLDIVNLNRFYRGFCFRFVKSNINKIINNHMKFIKETEEQDELKNKIDKISNDASSERTDNIVFIKNNLDTDEYNKLLKINTNSYIKSRDFLCWENDGIRFNFKLEKVGKVNDDFVIKDIVRKNAYLRLNNFYRIFIDSEIKYIYLDEDEFNNLISNIFLGVTFSYDIKYDQDKIIYLKNKRI